MHLDPPLLSIPPPSTFQGLIPWAWIEASTKGAVLLFATSELEFHLQAAGLGVGAAGILGGMGGGIAQVQSSFINYYFQ